MATNDHIIFQFKPQLLDVPKMRKFMNNHYHLTFEKADIQNNTKWFQIGKDKGYLPAMKKHMECTYPCFEWVNFKKWLETNDC